MYLTSAALSASDNRGSSGQVATAIDIGRGEGGVSRRGYEDVSIDRPRLVTVAFIIPDPPAHLHTHSHTHTHSLTLQSKRLERRKSGDVIEAALHKRHPIARVCTPESQKNARGAKAERRVAGKGNHRRLWL